VAYTGPERRQQAQLLVNYEREYAFARAAAACWPADRLRRALESLMAIQTDCEAAWATLDAFTDLLLEQIPPVWTGDVSGVGIGRGNDH
jgi:hypothetical protein